MSRISLTASMRSNLLSLQNISRQVSSTQNKLATGNKVNSAIDNPGSYYTARSLNNRADDLNALLDSMGQAVSTIKAATTALETGADFLEQASAIATSALETAKDVPAKSWFEQQAGVAAVVSSWDELKAALNSGKTGNIVIYGSIEAQDAITLKTGQNLVGVGYYGIAEPSTDKFSQLSFNLEKTGTAPAITVSANNTTLSDLSIKAVATATSPAVMISAFNTSGNRLHNMDLLLDVSQQPAYQDLPMDNIILNRGGWTVSGTTNFCAPKMQNKLIVISATFFCNLEVYDNFNIDLQLVGGRGIRSSTVNTHQNAVLNVIATNAFQDTNANINDNTIVNIQAHKGIALDYSGYFNINDHSRINISATGSFASQYIKDSPSNSISINSTEASLNISSPSLWENRYGLLTFNAIAGAEFSWNGKIYQTKRETSDHTMDGGSLPAGFAESAETQAETLPSLNWLSSQNTGRLAPPKDNGQKSFAEILSQYDGLIKDSSYKGVNLLRQEQLNVKFNETGSAALEVKGKDMSSAALGLTKPDWQTQGDIAQSLKEISAALKSIRSFSAELGNNYSIITSRQDFTENLINILTEGADKLTLADMNEESANILALQTRQQLAINSLSLASQASQAVLKLF